MNIDQSEFEAMSKKQKMAYALNNDLHIDVTINQLEFKTYYRFIAFGKPCIICEDDL